MNSFILLFHWKSHNSGTSVPNDLIFWLHSPNQNLRQPYFLKQLILTVTRVLDLYDNYESRLIQLQTSQTKIGGVSLIFDTADFLLHNRFLASNFTLSRYNFKTEGLSPKPNTSSLAGYPLLLDFQFFLSFHQHSIWLNILLFCVCKVLGTWWLGISVITFSSCPVVVFLYLSTYDLFFYGVSVLSKQFYVSLLSLLPFRSFLGTFHPSRRRLRAASQLQYHCQHCCRVFLRYLLSSSLQDYPLQIYCWVL